MTFLVKARSLIRRRQVFAIPDLDRPILASTHVRMRRGRRKMKSEEEKPRGGRLAALLKREFACSVRCLSGRMATSTIDLAAKN